MHIVPLMAALLVLGGCMPVVSSPDRFSSGRSSSGQSSATPGAPEDIHYHHPSGEAASFGQGPIVERGDPIPTSNSVGINELQPSESSPSPDAPASVSSPEAAARPLNVPAGDGKTYIVQPGDTVYSVARQHGISPTDLISINNLQAPYGLQLGQTLKLLGSNGSVPKSVLPKVDNRGFPSPEANKATPPFVAPVSAGRLAHDFGRRSGGEVNHGISIAAPKGTPIKAAGSGTVLYVGQNVPNLGRLVLLRHDRQWVTAYAHADKILVRKGQKVAKGDIIALVGDSGGAPTPQVHFQVRHASKPVDPLQYITYQGGAFREAGLERRRAL
jgi:murein DD-endopeptidase MepM/ murein hydrolase activator NlpD